ncbi:MAG TPA: glycoside hydrolase family 3 N-terminal domain-containing protein, partial [Kofleriaceae bacterium]|nr:glycoside hydrolase family 3 N-terminal domain-containing protein [Kofleriaceae bacterium]
MTTPTALLALFSLALPLAACVGEGAGKRRAREVGKVGQGSAGADPRDLELLGRMTLRDKVNQLMQFSAGPATGPDSAGRPRDKSLEELAREGIGSFMWFTRGAADVNRMQRIAVTESRLGIPIVFAIDIIHG